MNFVLYSREKKSVSRFITEILAALPNQFESSYSMLRSTARTVMGHKGNVIVIVGTTGVGKSQLSIELAKRFNGEVINADSMQMYKGAGIITNKHPMIEREGIQHHVMNHVDWNEEYFIHRFQNEARMAINDIQSRGKVPIVVGGTHYYLNSLLFNNKTIKREGPDEADKSEKLTADQLRILDGSPEEVFEVLKQKDSKIAEKFHPNDTRRVRRALEIYFLTNKKTSEHYSDQVDTLTTGSSLNYRTLVFWLYADKPTLDKRLDDRVDKMLKNGGLKEIDELYDCFSASSTRPDLERGIWQVIGFKEFIPWLEDGKKDDALFKQSITDMKTRTRQYAKRQVKWIRDSLAVDLAKEKSHEFINGGKLYLLDATDLDEWGSNVSDRGISVTESFLANTQTAIAQAPERLKNLLPSEEKEEDESEDKSSQWKHFTCESCFNQDDSPLILVGSKQYEIHLKSKRHRSNLQRGKRKRDYEEWLAKQQRT